LAFGIRHFLMPPSHLALDLGAGSGRAFIGHVRPDRLECHEVHRFSYQPRVADGHLRWDMARLVDGLDASLARAAADARARGWEVTSIGVDSWGVDYGLVDVDGRLVEEPICYRDARTDRRLVDDVLTRVPAADLFARTGIQLMPINTLFQLAAHVREGIPPAAARLLMIPDLCHHRLCGADITEFTNATTTQLLRAGARTWDDELFTRLDLPRALMPPIADAGRELGVLRPDLQRSASLGAARVLAPATHDTGSAVVGTPLTAGAAFISSGTWSLVGVERHAPILHADAARANVTNEGGAFGTVRLLKNVMGLWILESCRREWGAPVGHGFPPPPTASARLAGASLASEGSSPAGGCAYAELLADVGALDEFAGFIYPDDPRFMNPDSMTTAIRSSLAESGQHPHDEPVALARVVLDSLAFRYASVLDTIERLTGSPITTIHIVGGGSRNEYLNQATANASGRTVMAGPAEATVIGNLVVQAIASGEIGSVAEARETIRRTARLTRYEPRDDEAWEAARAGYAEVEARAEGR
jgi:rhamnulokinase